MSYKDKLVIMRCMCNKIMDQDDAGNLVCTTCGDFIFKSELELTLKDFLEYMTSEEIKTAIHDAAWSIFIHADQESVVGHVSQICKCVDELKRRDWSESRRMSDAS